MKISSEERVNGGAGEPDTRWFVYILRTAAGHLYTGISTDPRRRLQEHASGKNGARSLRGKGPLTLQWQQEAADRSQASRLEAAIKKLGKADKEEIIKRRSIISAPM